MLHREEAVLDEEMDAGVSLLEMKDKKTISMSRRWEFKESQGTVSVSLFFLVLSSDFIFIATNAEQTMTQRGAVMGPLSRLVP